MTMKWFLCSLLLLSTNCFSAVLSDEQIRQAIVDESNASAKKPCPCPYSTHPDGRQCGRRSAYRKVKDNPPICYTINVTSQQVDDYRAKHPN